MKTQTNNNKLLYVLGKCLGQPLAWVLRKQKRLVNWLVAKGLPAGLAKLLFMVANLFILVAILLAILPSWIVVGVTILTAIVYLGVDIDIEAPKTPELRNGWDGFGYYNEHDFRLDGSADDED